MAFSFSDLLVLLDVDGVCSVASALPTVAEGAALLGRSPPAADACADVDGRLRFRTGLNHLYEAPVASLEVTPFHARLDVRDFADSAIFDNIHTWLSGYLIDTLRKGTKAEGRSGFRAYFGAGVVVEYGICKPGNNVISRDALIDLIVRRDEPPIATLRTLLGIGEAAIAPTDANWRELPTRWPMRLEAARLGDRVGLRWSAPRHDGQQSAASKVDTWRSNWTNILGEGSGRSRPDGGIEWPILRIGSVVQKPRSYDARRDVYEIHIPASWLPAPPG